MSIPSNVLEAVSAKPRGSARSRNNRLDKAACLVADFAQERSLEAFGALDALLERADEASSACEGGLPSAAEILDFRREADEISEQTQVLQNETQRFLQTLTR